MSCDLTCNEDFRKACRNATLKAFKDKINIEQVYDLLEHMPNSSCNSGTIGATASLVSALIWSKVKCYPDNQPWKFEESAWGPGIGGGESIGFMYTAYTGENAWDAFFKNTTGYHAQGIAEVGGIFQITWFRSDGVPIGQFNGALAGAGVFEIGGSGHWKNTCSCL